jgi:hypothetical protein
MAAHRRSKVGVDKSFGGMWGKLMEKFAAILMISLPEIKAIS